MSRSTEFTEGRKGETLLVAFDGACQSLGAKHSQAENGSAQAPFPNSWGLAG
jgi:hypothetical protein